MATYDGNNLTGNEKFRNGDIISFSYSGSIKEIDLPAGSYLIEMAGGSGGNGGNARGGYGSKISFKKQLFGKYYVICGGRGKNSTNWSTVYSGGYNGGGTSSPVPNNDCAEGSGGGCSSITTKNALLMNCTLSDVIAVAAGGGGGTAYIGQLEIGYGGNGGPIGGSGGTGGSGNSGHGTAGTGGSQTGPGTNFDTARKGGFGYGGNAPRDGVQWYKPYAGGGSGGGAGLYGGGAGLTSCAGGGGSSFCLEPYSDPTFSSYTGDGYIIITLLSLLQKILVKDLDVSQIKTYKNGYWETL